VEIAVERLGYGGRWTREGAHLANHWEYGGKRIGWVGLKGNMEDGGRVDYAVDRREVIFRW